MSKEFEKKFKAAIKAKGISQKEIAVHLGLTESNFSKKLKTPYQSFTDTEGYLIKNYTGLDFGKLMGLDYSDRATALLDYEQHTIKILRDIQARLATVESLLSKISSKLK